MDSVLNWLWQGCVVAVACGVMLRVLERARANVRYVVCWTALLFIVALPGLPSLQSSAAALDAVGTAPDHPIVSLPVAWWTSTLAMLALWMAWASVHVVRFVAAIVAIRRARAQSCLPLAGGIAPAALVLRPLHGASRDAGAVGFGDDRGGPRLGDADDCRRPIACEIARPGRAGSRPDSRVGPRPAS